MRKDLLKFLFCVLLSTQLFSQVKTTPEELKADVVKITDGIYKMDVLRLITSNGLSTQVKAHSECAQTAISRDNFIFYTTSILFKVLDELTPEGAKHSDLDELIGKPDYEINLFMGKNGLQLEFISDKGTERKTIKWDDIWN